MARHPQLEPSLAGLMLRDGSSGESWVAFRAILGCQAALNGSAALRIFCSTENGVSDCYGILLGGLGVTRYPMQPSNEGMNLTSHAFAEWLAGYPQCSPDWFYATTDAAQAPPA